MPDYSPHYYRVTSVPAGCTKYVVDQSVELMVPEPPPATITLTNAGACSGTTLELDE